MRCGRGSAMACGGSSTQWATAGAPEAPCGKEWWARQEKDPPTKPGWAEPRTTARSWCSVNHLGHHAEQGTCGSRTRKHREACCGRPEDGGVWTAKTVKRPPQQPAQPQYANYWAPLTRKRHILATSNTPTAGLHERGNDTSSSTCRSGRQKAATNATCEGKNG